MMKPEASPFYNPVSSCEASDAGVVNTRASIDPGGVAQQLIYKKHLEKSL